MKETYDKIIVMKTQLKKQSNQIEKIKTDIIAINSKLQFVSQFITFTYN